MTHACHTSVNIPDAVGVHLEDDSHLLKLSCSKRLHTSSQHLSEDAVLEVMVHRYSHMLPLLHKSPTLVAYMQQRKRRNESALQALYNRQRASNRVETSVRPRFTTSRLKARQKAANKEIGTIYLVARSLISHGT